MDPEAFKKAQDAFKAAMEKPEVQEKMEELRKQAQKLDDQFAAAVARVLSPRQRTNYKKMLGAPFDRSKLGGPPWAQPGTGRNAPSQGAAKNGTAVAKSTQPKPSNSEDDDAESNSAAKQPSPKPGATDASGNATTRRRNSLRAARGIAPSKPDE
jgi:hypothetical protein